MPRYKRLESARMTGQHDDLMARRRVGDYVEKFIEPTVVAIDERVIQDDRHRSAARRQHVGIGKPGQNRQLLT